MRIITGLGESVYKANAHTLTRTNLPRSKTKSGRSTFFTPFFPSISHRLYLTRTPAHHWLHIHQMALLFTSRYSPFFPSLYFPLHLVHSIGIPFFSFESHFPIARIFLFICSFKKYIFANCLLNKKKCDEWRKNGKTTTSSWQKIRSINIDRIELLPFAQCYSLCVWVCVYMLHFVVLIFNLKRLCTAFIYQLNK